MNEAREGASLSISPAGAVHVIGGLMTRVGVEALDLRSNRWLSLPLTMPLIYPATRYIDGSLYVIGSVPGAHRFLRFDPRTEDFEFPNPSSGLGPYRVGVAHAKLPDERVFLMGGTLPPGLSDSPTFRSEYVLDPYSLTATEIARLPFRRQYAAAVALPDGRILVIGGQRVSDGATLDTVTYYSPTGDFWR